MVTKIYDIETKKLLLTITYSSTEIEEYKGDEDQIKRFKKIFNKKYQIRSGGHRQTKYYSTLNDMKPGDEGYIEAVLYDIVQWEENCFIRNIE